MFLDRLNKTNKSLVDLAFSLHQQGAIEPDTYIVDLDSLIENAQKLKKKANEKNIQLYFMLKQLGRNPLIAQTLDELGYAGAVCVDYREATTLGENGVRLGHVGNLVQIPLQSIERILTYRPEIVTVFSREEAKRIGEVAERLGFVQSIMLKVLDTEDVQYSGQSGGFYVDELEQVEQEIAKTSGVHIAGVCSFPCFLFSDQTNRIETLHNVSTVQKACEYLHSVGYDNLQVNLPSQSCTALVDRVSQLQGTHMEPGHGLTGTTPYHAAGNDMDEKTSYVYVSEISHNLGSNSYCYGGGFYRRGHLHRALVGKREDSAKTCEVNAPTSESIDYYFELSQNATVGDTVLMCFRAQMFVTRSHIAVVRGLSHNAPVIEGVFDSQGRKIR